MSGTGKSSALRMLALRGYAAVDTDTDQWSRWVVGSDGAPDWIWREDALRELLVDHGGTALFVSGCKTNQGAFYPYFEHVVLLSAPAEILLARITARTTNSYGKTPGQQAEVLRNLAEVEPLLRAGATSEIDASAPLGEVVRKLEALVG
jgi:hypothetical protein